MRFTGNLLHHCATKVLNCCRFFVFFCYCRFFVFFAAAPSPSPPSLFFFSAASLFGAAPPRLFVRWEIISFYFVCCCFSPMFGCSSCYSGKNASFGMWRSADFGTLFFSGCNCFQGYRGFLEQPQRQRRQRRLPLGRCCRSAAAAARLRCSAALLGCAARL